MRYFKITAKQGHCGAGRYRPITFAVYGNNLLEAMDHVKKMPSVKHREMILCGHEISFSEYCAYRKISAYERVENNAVGL